MVKIAVIGGGIAGCSAALILSNFFQVIDVFEKEEEILAKTSKRWWARLHTGLHYPLKKQRGILAAKCSFAVAPFYADFLLDSKRPQYFCAKNRKDQLTFPLGGLLTPDDYLAYASWLSSSILSDEIKTQYPEGIELLGTPLWGIIPPEDEIYPQSAGIGLETNERVIDLDELIKTFRFRIKNNPNINLYLNTEIRSITAKNDGKYLVVRSNGVQDGYDYIINASRWSATSELKINSQKFIRQFKEDYPELRFYAIAENIDRSLEPTHQYIHSNKSVSYAYSAGSNTAIIEASPKSLLEVGDRELSLDEWLRYTVHREVRAEQKFLELAQEILVAARQEYPTLKTANIHQNGYFITPMIQPSIQEHEYMERIFFGTPGERGKLDRDGYFYVRGAKVSDSVLYSFYILQQIIIAEGISDLKNDALSKTPAEFMTTLIREDPHSFTLKKFD